jgi:hypothetical protein
MIGGLLFKRNRRGQRNRCFRTYLGGAVSEIFRRLYTTIER